MTKEALKLALEALEEAWYHVGTFQPTEKAIDLYDEARTAIKEALAQPEQDREEMKIKSVIMRCKDYDVALPIIYNDFGRVLVGQVSIPPQRTWVGLTRTELIKCGVFPFGMSYKLCKAIEAKLKKKNT